jgi:hypothetical protein
LGEDVSGTGWLPDGFASTITPRRDDNEALTGVLVLEIEIYVLCKVS